MLSSPAASPGPPWGPTTTAIESHRPEAQSRGFGDPALPRAPTSSLLHHPPEPTSRWSASAVTGPSSFSLHQRQQSAPSLSLLPPAQRLPSPARSPTRGHTRHQSQDVMPLTGDGRGRPGREASFGAASSPDTTPRSVGRGGTPADNTTPKSATPSRFGFFASSVSALTGRLTNQPPTPRQLNNDDEYDDELCNLDIEAALFPRASMTMTTTQLGQQQQQGSFGGGGGAPDHRGGGGGGSDAFSPAAYKNLQANAAGQLHRLRAAYRERTAALRELRAEREAQREEAEEAELRVRHFRAQLERMAARAAEQEASMQQLVAELRVSQQQQQQRQQHQHHHHHQHHDDHHHPGGSGEAESVVLPSSEEDLGGVEQREEEEEEEGEGDEWRRRQLWRTSDLSSTAGTGTDTESVFSRSRSPTTTVLTSGTTTERESLDASTSSSSPATAHAHAHAHARAGSTATVPTLAVPQQQRPRPAQQLSTFQKLVKGMSSSSSSSLGEGAGAGAGAGAMSCRNCQGRDSSVAWDTVSLLRDENRGLKQRVAQLEVAVEGALDAVNGFGL
ncbi:hypothetical protein GGR56DRAFT_687329 [Xylariaceae sp. FL0804]|nr:hypothetical protein GGR56DRAFT_687329 [Xylariaceae sp. FL0804]